MKKTWIVLLGLVLLTVSCNKEESRDSLPIEGTWEGRVYTNERAKFSVEVPESVQMGEVINLNNNPDNLRVKMFGWELRSPQGMGDMLYYESVVKEDFFPFSKVLKSLKKDETVVNLTYEPWYKMLRTCIVAEKQLEDGTYWREYHYMCHNQRYLIEYPTDENFSNPEMEQFMENLQIDISYSAVLGEVNEGVATVIGVLIAILAAMLWLLFEFIPKALKPVVGVIAVAGVVGLVWLVTGVPCPTTYWMMGIIAGFFVFEVWYMSCND